MKPSAAGAGSTAKHAGTSKQSRTAAGKHAPAKPPVQTIRVVGSGHVTVTLKMPKPPKPRGLALGDAWACCSAEALGASLRLAGRPVSQDDVLALHVAAGGTRDRGVPVLAALRAASVCGLAGARPLWWRPLDAEEFIEAGGFSAEVGDSPARGAEGFQDAAADVGLPGRPDVPHRAALAPAGDRQPFVEVDGGGDLLGAHSLILGLELPGAHAVTVGSDGCWLSWGGHYDPGTWPGAVVEEAWAVAW